MAPPVSVQLASIDLTDVRIQNTKTDAIIKADSPWKFDYTQVMNDQTRRQRRQYIATLQNDVAVSFLPCAVRRTSIMS